MSGSADEVDEKHSTIFLGLVLTLRASALELVEAKDLAAARGMVDTVEMLESKTRGNLSDQEQLMVRSVLTELRMAVVRAETPGSTISPSADPEKK